MLIKAVLWDMDGTLIDSEHNHIQALEEAMKTHGLPVPDDLYLLATGMSAENVYRWMQKDFGLKEEFDAWLKLKYSKYMGLKSSLEPFSDALEVWNELEAKGVAQAIVSNSDRIIVDANLNGVGLSKARAITVSRNDVRKGKPDAEPYLRAAWLLDVEPNECIVIEDSPTGALAGLAAGMQSFLVPNTPSSPPDGVVKLESYNQILDIIAS